MVGEGAVEKLYDSMYKYFAQHIHILLIPDSICINMY